MHESISGMLNGKSLVQDKKLGSQGPFPTMITVTPDTQQIFDKSENKRIPAGLTTWEKAKEIS